MRTLIWLAVLALGFGAAALWQEHHLDGLRRERDEADRQAQGHAARTSSGTLLAGQGVLLIGEPSGATPFPRPSRPSRPNAGGDLKSAPTLPAPRAGDLGDYSLRVQSGQTLSGISHLHYGSSQSSLVRALADYNHLASPDALVAGHELKLPPIERLTEAAPATPPQTH